MECSLKPAFALTLRALDGPVPTDTLLRVKYGGGVEEYRVSDAVQTQEVTFCQRRSEDGGAVPAGEPPSEVTCELWTQGAATIAIETSSYPRLDSSLEAEAEGRCIQTVEVTLTLGEGDGGV